MNDLYQALKSIVDSVEKAAKDREAKIASISEKQGRFWQTTGDPALRNLAVAINQLPERDSEISPSYQNDPAKTLKVRNRQRDGYEFTFDLKITRDDLSLFVALGNDEKEYPIEEISAERIHKAFFDQYEKALGERLISK